MATRQPTPQELIADVDVIPLLAGREPDLELEDRELYDSGNVYHLLSKDNGAWELTIALHASVREARDLFEKLHREVAIGPMEPAPRIGDECKLWMVRDPTAGAILFRRANALVRVGGMNTREARVETARFLDTALRTDNVHVKRAPTVTPPEIKRVDLPSKMKPNQVHRAAIEVENIDPLDALIVVMGPSMLVEKRPTPVLIYDAAPAPCEERFLLVISSPGNLISTKEVVVQVEEADAGTEGEQTP